MYYKVVFNDEGRLLSVSPSCWWGRLRQAFEVVYKLNEWVYPKFENSKLFVFPSLAAAKEFVSRTERNHLHIYECEVENPEKETSYFVPYLDGIEDLANGYDVQYAPCPYTDTVFADGVKLIRKVY